MPGSYRQPNLSATALLKLSFFLASLTCLLSPLYASKPCYTLEKDIPKAIAKNCPGFSILQGCLKCCYLNRDDIPNIKKADWTWKDKSQCIRTVRELRNILEPKDEKISLQGADLTGIDFSKFTLCKISFQDTILDSADFSNVNWQVCSQASRPLDWRNAKLRSAALPHAFLEEADLSEADLTGADLSGAKMINANLTFAYLVRTKLDGTDLTGADLTGARVYPSQDAGYAAAMANAASLEFLNAAPQSRIGLSLLRDAFRQAGLDEQARRVTYALNRIDKVKDIESFLKLILFEYTSSWGMKPFRCVRLLLLCLALFTFPYAVVIHRTKRPQDAKIHKVWPADSWFHSLKRPEELKPVSIRAEKRLKALFWGLLFSILCTCHIGWQEIDLKVWVERLIPGGYTLRASGWVRTLAGAQSLLSIYFIILFALTYFGRPFG